MEYSRSIVKIIFILFTKPEQKFLKPCDFVENAVLQETNWKLAISGEHGGFLREFHALHAFRLQPVLLHFLDILFIVQKVKETGFQL